MQEAERCGLYCRTDLSGNVIVKKPASPGKDSSEPVIIQGHLDMVCAKAPGRTFDFKTDAVEVLREGDFLTANGTTLGADDGIAVAYALALMADSSAVHPPLEIILTSDEETGMNGARGLDLSDICSRRLINIDSDREGVFTVSCAGGARASLEFKAEKSRCSGILCCLSVSGLRGGHSGTEIDKGGLNANKVIADILADMADKADINIINLEGGDKDNAIPKNSICRFAVNEESVGLLAELSAERLKEYKELFPAEDGIDICVKACGEFCGDAFGTEFSRVLIRALCELPNGVTEMDPNIGGLVKTSLNLGTLNTQEGGIKAVFSLRSNENAGVSALSDLLGAAAQKYGAHFEISGSYPAWEYAETSPLREKMLEVYRRLYGKEPIVTAIHAGLECGIFAGKLPQLDAVSIGPDMYDIHTSDERVSLSSVNRVWEFLKAVLKEL